MVLRLAPPEGVIKKRLMDTPPNVVPMAEKVTTDGTSHRCVFAGMALFVAWCGCRGVERRRLGGR